jgi:threonine/homoserine/homoserine lactone efflux protein
MSAFLSGLIIGFSIAAPVGPIGMLCIKRTIISGRLCGILTGFGAATADGAYGMIAAAGLTALTSALLAAGPVLKVVGALFLLYLGWKSITSATGNGAQPLGAETAPRKLHRDARAAATACTTSGENSSAESRPLGAFVSSLFLTLTNPMTILSFLAILGTAAPIDDSLAAKILMVTGIFIGSCVWWLILTSAVSLLKFKPGGHTLRVLNIMSGCVLIGFAILAFR